MIELKAHSAGNGLDPIKTTGVDVTEIWPLELYSVAPFRGQEDTVSEALRAQFGLPLPAIGKVSTSADRRVFWSGRGHFFVMGGAPGALRAAVTDQSDAWCAVGITGADMLDVLARLCPLDLESMPEGAVARSLIGHMQAIILRVGDGFELMVFRAFAHTLWRELGEVARSVEAQHDLINRA